MDLHRALGEAIISAKSDAIVAANKDGNVVFWNPGAERIFGYASADALGQSLDIIIPTRLQKRHWDGYHRVMKTGETRYGHGDILAVPAIKKNGMGLSIEFSIVPLRNETGELVGLIAIIRDVTRRFEEIHALKQKLKATAKDPLFKGADI
ncbi:MAG TPA: PAS domain S-box protein [Candidatus Udaeobacter sp.]|jgi:PAS domain S-box-containing protein|nr:PAS domain S-box protein [Candidatus Udaeobacter sp.]